MMKKNSGQSGYVLLEALVAMLIFSLGLLGLIGFQAASTKIATDSRFRTEAAMLADELLAKMAASEISQVEADYAVGVEVGAASSCGAAAGAGLGFCGATD